MSKKTLILIAVSSLCLTRLAPGTLAQTSNTTAAAGAPTVGSITSETLHFEAGAVILNPFTLSLIPPAAGKPNTYQLKLGGAIGRPMFQGVFEDRSAWLSPQTSSKLVHNWFFENWDAEVRVGYTTGNSSSSSGSSTPGSGDFFGEWALGFHPFPGFKSLDDEANTLIPHTFNIEAFGNFASDSQYSQVHSGVGAGLAYAAGIPWSGLDSTTHQLTNRVQLLGRIGMALDESPDIIGSNTNGPLVRADSSGSPSLSFKPAVSYTIEARVPVAASGNASTSYGCISVGGTVYQFLGSAPDQWSLYVAYSVDPTKILDALKNLGGN